MNPALLRQIYKMHRIEKRKLRWYKTPKELDPEKAEKLLAKMKRELAKAKKDGYRVVYIDETMFTRKTCPDKEWCLPNQNMAVDLAKLEEPTLALLCGVSKEKGVEHFQVFEHSVNVDKFTEYLDGLRAANPDAKIALFMDNLSAHTSERAKKAMRDHGFRYIYNVPYSPDYNPIELVFSQIKSYFKALRAKKFIGQLQDCHEAVVVKSVMKVKKGNVVKCVDHVNKILR